ncbi:DOMON-like domain-containing protein [Sphingomonas sp.]|uniref:DOMON-like domain-containing protein n=1 Tax=Sphingomonas sp. TaxID=28214 RepID=UPI002B927E39|nr:DOMON-like domain-containing protein [Sphingomonas sp.]HWK36912.1 DOMON-like domain-containing protein [Sphingomonas sp.]
MIVSLVPHPDHPPRAIRAVEVALGRSVGDALLLSYRVAPAASLLLPDHGGVRMDGLWRSTCFELFVKEFRAAAYREFNFAPTGAWAAYGFDDWRTGMTPLEIEAPHLVDCRLDDRAGDYRQRYELDVVLAAHSLPARPGSASVTAVIEENDGTKSYWALRHPPGKPDFHHPDCFAIELPAPDAP